MSSEENSADEAADMTLVGQSRAFDKKRFNGGDGAGKKTVTKRQKRTSPRAVALMNGGIRRSQKME